MTLLTILRSYIFNRGWIDQSERRIPTYSEVTSNKKGKGKAVDSGSEAGDDDEAQRPTIYSDVDEEDFEDTVDRFEASYNYRFEEPYVYFLSSRTSLIQATVMPSRSNHTLAICPLLSVVKTLPEKTRDNGRRSARLPRCRRRRKRSNV